MVYKIEVKYTTDHYFVQHTSRRVRHFVKFINTTDTTIAQHKSTAKKEQWVSKESIIGYHIDITNLSKTSCFVSASRVTYAVKPTAEEPFPDAKTPRGAIL